MAITFNNTVFPSGHVGPTLAPSGNSVTQAGVSPGQFTVNGTVNAPGDPVSVTNAFNVTSTFVATQLDDPGRILLNQQGTLNHFLFSNTPLPQGLNTVTFSNATLGDFQVVCFATGTRILTEAGEVPIEALREGMLAAVADAAGRVVGHKPIRWIGRQTVRCAGGWRPGQAAIRIRAGALGPGVPKRDLVVSMAHGIALGGCWVRAAALVNGASIVTEPPPPGGVMTYWHVELEDHAILLAEGAPAESYLDDGNRAAFDNGLPHLRAPWASGDPAAGASYAARACLPLTAPGQPGFAEVQAALLDRAPLAAGVVRTDDPALRLVADGAAWAPDAEGWATLPAAAWRQGVALASRSAVPAEVLAGSLDRRRLGARVSAITLRSGRLVRRLAAADPAFDGAPGWHAAEAEDAVAWRWTEGEALLPAGAFAGFDPSEPVALRVELMGGLCYFVAEGERRAA